MEIHLYFNSLCGHQHYFMFSDFFFLVEQTIGSLQKKYSIGSFELLSKTAPIQAVSLLLFGPFIDYYLSGKFIIYYQLSSGAIVSTHTFLNYSSLIVYSLLYVFMYIFERKIFNNSDDMALMCAGIHTSFMLPSSVL